MKTISRLASLTLALCLPALGLAAAADISREELKARQAKGDPVVIVDVRSAEEFAAGHIAGALNIPHDQLADRAGELAAHQADGSLVLYCRSGRRTGLAVETLEARGFSRLNHLTGDMQGWQEAGEAVTK